MHTYLKGCSKAFRNNLPNSCLITHEGASRILPSPVSLSTFTLQCFFVAFTAILMLPSAVFLIPLCSSPAPLCVNPCETF